MYYAKCNKYRSQLQLALSGLRMSYMIIAVLWVIVNLLNLENALCSFEIVHMQFANV